MILHLLEHSFLIILRKILVLANYHWIRLSALKCDSFFKLWQIAMMRLIFNDIYIQITLSNTYYNQAYMEYY